MLSMNLKKIGEGQVGMQLDATIEDEFIPSYSNLTRCQKVLNA